MSGSQKQTAASKPAQNKLWGGRFTGIVLFADISGCKKSAGIPLSLR